MYICFIENSKKKKKKYSFRKWSMLMNFIVMKYHKCKFRACQIMFEIYDINVANGKWSYQFATEYFDVCKQVMILLLMQLSLTQFLISVSAHFPIEHLPKRIKTIENAVPQVTFHATMQT